MKKKSLKVLLCSTLLAMALTVSACGEKDAGKDSAEVSSEKETQQEQEEKEVEKEESEPVKLEDAEPITEKFPDIKSYGYIFTNFTCHFLIVFLTSSTVF